MNSLDLKTKLVEEYKTASEACRLSGDDKYALGYWYGRKEAVELLLDDNFPNWKIHENVK